MIILDLIRKVLKRKSKAKHLKGAFRYKKDGVTKEFLE